MSLLSSSHNIVLQTFMYDMVDIIDYAGQGRLAVHTGQDFRLTRFTSCLIIVHSDGTDKCVSSSVKSGCSCNIASNM